MIFPLDLLKLKTKTKIFSITTKVREMQYMTSLTHGVFKFLGKKNSTIKRQIFLNWIK